MRTGKATEQPVTPSRRTGVRLLALLGLVTFSFMFLIVAADALGLISSEPVGAPDDPAPSSAALEGAKAPGEVVHVVGTLAVVAIGGSGLIALLGRPGRSGAGYQVLAAALGLIIATAIVGNPDNRGGQAGSVDPAFLVLALPPLGAGLASRPWRSRRPNGVLNKPLLALAVIGMVPAAWYGIDQALLQRNTFPPTADPHHQAHWFAMAVFAFVVVLVVASGSLAGRGWRLATGAGGLGAVAIGAGSLVAGGAASALAPAWAGAALMWGLAVLWFTARPSGPPHACLNSRPL